jgi:hypothetical protein
LTTEEINTRERIFKATLEFIREGKDAHKLTTRQIGIGLGESFAGQLPFPVERKSHRSGRGNDDGRDHRAAAAKRCNRKRSETRLRENILTTADAAFEFYNVSRIAIAGELKEGCRNSCQMVLPLLQEIFKGYTLPDLNVIALQLMLPFHHIVVDPDLYGKYLGADFFDEKQRRRKINQMVDLVLARYDKEAKE